MILWGILSPGEIIGVPSSRALAILRELSNIFHRTRRIVVFWDLLDCSGMSGYPHMCGINLWCLSVKRRPSPEDSKHVFFFFLWGIMSNWRGSIRNIKREHTDQHDVHHLLEGDRGGRSTTLWHCWILQISKNEKEEGSTCKIAFVLLFSYAYHSCTVSVRFQLLYCSFKIHTVGRWISLVFLSPCTTVVISA